MTLSAHRHFFGKANHIGLVEAHGAKIGFGCHPISIRLVFKPQF